MSQLPRIPTDPFGDRESALSAAARVPDEAPADETAAQAVALALEASPVPSWPHRVDVSLHESVLVYFQQQIEEYGVVRVQTTKEGIELWVGNELRWKSGATR